MAGRTARKPKAESPTLDLVPNYSLVASAARYSGKVPRIYTPARAWQAECYRHYSICGEARYAANYFGHSLARTALYAAADLKGDPLTSGPAFDALNGLFNGSEGQSQMLDAIGRHLTIAGACYLVGRNVAEVDAEGEPTGKTSEVWEILSVLEVKVTGNGWSIVAKEEGQADIELAEEDVVIRIWIPHPERRMEADSPFRSLLPILSEIEYLTRHIFAQCTSRLAGAGLLFLTQGVEFPPPPLVNGKPQETRNAAEGLMLALAEGMLRPLENPESPESLVPLTVTVPEEVMKSGKIAELMHFWTDLDAASLSMRTAAIYRFALGMDLPSEKLLGISGHSGTGGGKSNGVSHWGAWQIDEETIKIHIEPMLETVCANLAVAFLRPLTGGTEVIRYDTSNLRLRPDRSKEALELWDRGLLNSKRTLEENGFKAEDIPDDKERRVWILMKMAAGSATPEQVNSAAKLLGVTDLPELADPTAMPRETRPVPSITDHPTRQAPEAASLLLHTCEPIVLRALERAGNRLRQTGAKPPGVPAYEVHTMVKANGSTKAVLEDAFTGSTEMCLAGIGDPALVVPVLESYVSTLLTEQSPHTRERLNQWLTLAELVPVA